jgi:hypothetical protein
MKDRIKQSIKLDWQKIKPLQPENVKLPYNTQHLKKSLLKYGFSLPFYVWESEGEYYCIDGHHRLDVLNELIAEGHKVPKELNAVEIEAKDRKEAISILVSVFNQKSNPFAEEYLIEFLEVENIDIQEVSIESVNVVVQNVGALGDFENENTIDYSILDDDEDFLKSQTEQMSAGVKKAIQIEFENEHYEEAYQLVKFWREQKLYVGGFLMEKLKAEKEKL